MTGTKVSDKRVERGIEDMVGAMFDPIIVMPGGWGDTLPEWIKTQITLERLVENMTLLRGGTPTGTDAEACAYLYTASLTAPISGDWVQIYLHIAGKMMAKAKNTEVPDDIRVENLTDSQQRQLQELKAWLYQVRIKARKTKRGTAQVGTEPPSHLGVR